MVVDRTNYAVLWRPLPSQWRRGHREPLPNPMPYLVATDAAHDCSGKVSADGFAREDPKLRPADLLGGVLYAWMDLLKVSGGAAREQRRAALRDLFERYRRKLHSCSLERLLLELATRARARHGPLVSARMLFAARQICPQDSQLRVGLIYDVWRLLEHAEHLDIESACETIVDAYEGLECGSVKPDVLQGADYAYCVALHLLTRREALEEFFWSTAAKRVRERRLRERLFLLLENSSLDLSDLKISEKRRA